MRSSCVIYDTWADQILNLPAEMAGEYAQAILKYAIYGEEMDFNNPALKAMFVPVKKRLDTDLSKYREKVERMKNNSTRNRNEVVPKSTRNRNDIVGDNESESVNDNDNESVNVNDSVNESLKDKKHIYGEYKHIRLTDTERDRLFNDFGEAETLEAIKYLDAYKARQGYKCKNDNLTIRKWVFDALKREKGEQQSNYKSLAEKWGLDNDDQ